MMPFVSLTLRATENGGEMGVYRTAGLDRTSVVLTGILSGAPVVSLAVALFSAGEVRYTALTITAILSLICMVTYALAPSRYVVLEDRIVIRRHLWLSSSIPMKDVRSCYPYPRLKSTRMVRLIGNGGAFGWYGVYSSDELGTFRMYATDRAKAVVIANDAKYVLSPDRQENFLAAVKQYADLVG
jgi:hypothetical protein